MSAAELRTTPLHALHRELGAKMVPFAGYEMPVNYPGGIIAEHKHCRESASLFDVSHMGQIKLGGADAAKALESLMPIDVLGLAVGRQRYGLFTNASGGILDDLMIARPQPRAGLGELLLIVNAACKAADATHLQTNIGHRCTVTPLPERALLALQGPKAIQVMKRLNPEVTELRFMDVDTLRLAGVDCFVSRSGYTGEDGFEISLPAESAITLAKALLAEPEVKPAGLGARDTLRLEAGLCLYGHDIGTTTSPVEAALTWAMAKVRRPGGERPGHYPGAAAIERQLAAGPPSRRVGLLGLERIPVREGAPVVDAHGRKLGHVTSGTLSPMLNKPIAMAYLAGNHSAASHEVYAEVRGSRQPMRVASLPFTPHRYYRG